MVSKNLGFEHAMKVVVSTINFIKSRGFNHRQFKTFLEDIESTYGDLIFHTEVRWLIVSRDQTLERFLNLFDEIEIFITEKNKTVSDIRSPDWLCNLAFLVDITNHLNMLNTGLQSKD